MPKRAHLIAGILAPLCLVIFFLSTVLTELFGSNAAVAQLKALIVTPGLWIMIPAIAAAGGSGMFLGQSRSGRLVDAQEEAHALHRRQRLARAGALRHRAEPLGGRGHLRHELLRRSDHRARSRAPPTSC